MYDVIHNQDKTERLFQNPFLEKLSHVHPATPIFFYTPVIAWFFYQAILDLPYSLGLVLFALGIVLWTLTEYALHRFIFHWPFVIKSKFGRRVHFLMHGVHHNYPRDSKRLVMPLSVGVPLASLFYVLYTFLFYPYQNALFSGFLFGYIIYDNMHFAIHHFPMNNKILRWIKANHLNHHYVNHDQSFGVSTPIWDYIFRTY